MIDNNLNLEMAAGYLSWAAEEVNLLIKEKKDKMGDCPTNLAIDLVLSKVNKAKAILLGEKTVED